MQQRSLQQVRVSVLCHNCATKPVSATKTDFIDDSLLLIPRNLLKAKDHREIPAYRLARHFLNVLDGFLPV
jgi:hypothetical protein